MNFWVLSSVHFQCCYSAGSQRAFPLRRSKRPGCERDADSPGRQAEAKQLSATTAKAQLRAAAANVAKHPQMLTPCHFRITACLDIHAQKTKLLHAFENSLSPSDPNMQLQVAESLTQPDLVMNSAQCLT